MRVECAGTSIVGEIEIEAPPEAVFDALVTPGDLAAWWGSETTYRTHDWKIDLRPGGEWSCQATSAGAPQSYVVRGSYLEVDPPRALAYTWMPGWDTIPATTVRFTLHAVPGGTRLEILHEGFAGYEKSQQGHGEGWKRVLGWLSAYCAGKGVSK